MIKARSGKKKPLVAIVCHGATQCDRKSQFTTDAFIRPIIMAGGSTILVPAIRDAVDIQTISQVCDALMLTGSSSMVSPARYNADHEEPDQNPDRDAVAFDLAEAMIGARKPVLGICLGMQELNVLYGGTLQYLDNHEMHMKDADWKDISIFDHTHDITITSPILSRFGESRQNIISAHRQGIRNLGSGLEIAAVADDGLIEAITGDKEGRVIGVQWHAERLKTEVDHGLIRNLIELA